MVLLFVRLKLRLFRNAMRSADGAIGLTLFTVLALTMGVSLTIIVRSMDPVARVVAAPLLGVVITVGWLVGPLLFGASDETIDTSRLGMFGLDPRKLAGGMAAAAVTGPGSIAAILPLAGLASRAPTIGHGLLGAVAAIVTVVFATSSSRLALTALGAGLRKRTSRDLTTLAAGLIAGVVGIAGQAFAVAGGAVSTERLEPVAAIAALTPFGWSADAIGRASTGEVVVPLVEITATVILIVVMLRSWVDLLSWVLENVEDSVIETDVGGHFASDRPGGVAPITAIIGKEVRYLRRHPRYRVQVISQAIVLVVGGAPFISAVIDRNPDAVLLGCIPGLTAGVTGSNLLGPDGRALWAESSALPSLSPVLRGRSLAFAGLGFVSALFVTFATALWTGGWQFVPVALGAAVGMALAGSGVGALTSVFAPTPFPDQDAPNPFATNAPGGGCLNGLITIVGVFIGLGFAAPILAGLALTRSDGLVGIGVALAAPAYGLMIWLGTTALAGRRADRRSPELISVLSV